MSTTTSLADWICDPADVEDPALVFYDDDSKDGPASICINRQVDLSLEQARLVAARLVHLVDSHTPASEDAVRFLSVPLEAINKARGTSHTPQSVAESLGIDVATATKADMTRIAQHIGGVLMHS